MIWRDNIERCFTKIKYSHNLLCNKLWWSKTIKYLHNHFRNNMWWHKILHLNKNRWSFVRIIKRKKKPIDKYRRQMQKITIYSCTCILDNISFLMLLRLITFVKFILDSWRVCVCLEKQVISSLISLSCSCGGNKLK